MGRRNGLGKDKNSQMTYKGRQTAHFFFRSYTEVSTVVGHRKSSDPQAHDIIRSIALQSEVTFVERQAQVLRPPFSEEEQLQQVRRRGKAESLEHWSQAMARGDGVTRRGTEIPLEGSNCGEGANEKRAPSYRRVTSIC